MSAKVHGDKFVGIIDRVCKPSINAALEIIEDCVEEHKWSMQCDRKNGIYTTVEYNKKIKEIDSSLQLLKEKVHG